MNNKDLWIKFENSLLNEAKSKRRISKLKIMFNVLERGLTKPFNKCTRADLEAFVTRLHRDQFLTEKGEKYSGSSKSDIKKFIKQFWKFFKGMGEDYPDEVRWIKTNISKDERPKEKDTISKEEAVRLAHSFNNSLYTIMTLILFDSGFRIQELLSCKKKDLTFEDFDTSKGKANKCFWINCNESKTMTRKIPIPFFTDDLNMFVNGSYYQALRDEEPLFNCQYFAYNKALKTKSKQVLGKVLSPHHLRHSSATFYSRELDGNMNLIADRFGWAYNSNELKLYIRRSGAYQKIGAKKVFDNDVVKLRDELDQVKSELKEMREALSKYMLSQPRILKAIEISRRKKV